MTNLTKFLQIIIIHMTKMVELLRNIPCIQLSGKIKYNRLTKVRSRQAVKLPAVQPVVMTTGHWPALFRRKK